VRSTAPSTAGHAAELRSHGSEGDLEGPCLVRLMAWEWQGRKGRRGAVGTDRLSMVTSSSRSC
jgi:hypothetical protein